MSKIIKNFVCAVDAGHYLGTAGKRCLKALDPNETREWVLNDRVARAFQERAAEYEGFLTVRVDDPTGRSDTTLQQRVALANAIDADLYISVHHNAGINGRNLPNVHEGGIEAYCSKTSTDSPAWRDAIYDAMIAAGGPRGNRASPKAKADWYVCVHTDMPAVLVECGFMDSADDLSFILDPDCSRRMGIAAADAVAAKAGLKRKAVTDSVLYDPLPAEHRYVGVDDAPDFARQTISALMACDALRGTGTEKGIYMTYDMLRLLTVMVRYADYLHNLETGASELPE